MTDIYLNADRKIIHGLTIEEGYEGDRDKKGALTGEGGILFKTSAGKNLFLRYSEFSFYTDGRPASFPKPKPPKKHKLAGTPLPSATAGVFSK